MKSLHTLLAAITLLAGATLFAGCSHSEKKAEEQDMSAASAQSSTTVAESPVNLGASSAGNAH